MFFLPTCPFQSISTTARESLLKVRFITLHCSNPSNSLGALKSLANLLLLSLIFVSSFHHFTQLYKRFLAVLFRQLLLHSFCNCWSLCLTALLQDACVVRSLTSVSSLFESRFFSETFPGPTKIPTYILLLCFIIFLFNTHYDLKWDVFFCLICVFLSKMWTTLQGGRNFAVLFAALFPMLETVPGT